MSLPIIDEADPGGIATLAVGPDLCHPSVTMPRILDDNPVSRGPVSVRDFISGPVWRDAGFHGQDIAGLPEAQDRLEADPVEPPRRSGVPAPSPAADVGRPAVDVAGHDIRLHLVANDPIGIL